MVAFFINPMITWISLLEYCFNDLKELGDFLWTLIYALELGHAGFNMNIFSRI